MNTAAALDAARGVTERNRRDLADLIRKARRSPDDTVKHNRWRIVGELAELDSIPLAKATHNQIEAAKIKLTLRRNLTRKDVARLAAEGWMRDTKETTHP